MPVSESLQLVKLGYDVRVAAPARQQSGVSHCLSLFSPVTVEQFIMPAPLEKVVAWKSAHLFCVVHGFLRRCASLATYACA